MNDCIYQNNPLGGGVGSHNGRCSRGLTSPDVHLHATHHAPIEGWCGNICGQCSHELANKRKEAVIRELTTEEQVSSKGAK